MTIEWLRDLIICIYGILGIIALIVIVVLFISIYRKLTKLMDSVQTTSDNVKQLIGTIKEQWVDPMVQIAAIIQGIKQGINLISRFFKKDSGGENE